MAPPADEPFPDADEENDADDAAEALADDSDATFGDEPLPPALLLEGPAEDDEPLPLPDDDPLLDAAGDTTDDASAPPVAPVAPVAPAPSVPPTPVASATGAAVASTTKGTTVVVVVAMFGTQGFPNQSTHAPLVDHRHIFATSFSQSSWLCRRAPSSVSLRYDAGPVGPADPVALPTRDTTASDCGL